MEQLGLGNVWVTSEGIAVSITHYTTMLTSSNLSVAVNVSLFSTTWENHREGASFC